jgi:hypothetical protein
MRWLSDPPNVDYGSTTLTTSGSTTLTTSGSTTGRTRQCIPSLTTSEGETEGIQFLVILVKTDNLF